MYYVGWAVRIASHHLKWFDRLLKYRPGFRRYIYGLARYIYRSRHTKNLLRHKRRFVI